MKPVLKGAALSLEVISLLSCSTSSNFYLFATEDRTSTSVSVSYKTFDGQDTIKIKVEGTTIKVDVKTKSGILDVKISSDNETPYEGHISNDMIFTVNVSPGDYTITLNGHDHSGSYKFDWGN
ncbi:MAG: hypothetical protein MJ238_05170 [Bacilli bacterium]|nr:hypothetical protein [Bacilli bacterium]